MIQSRSAAQTVLKRSLAAAAAAAAAQPAERGSGEVSRSSLPKQGELKVTRLPNGLMVGSLDTNRPVAHIGLMFRAGSRYEAGSGEAGLAHRLRNAIGLGTSRSSQINLLYRAGRLGSHFAATTTRDYLIVHMDILREYARDALPVLGESVCLPAFKWWELEESTENMHFELQHLHENPEKYLLELLHKAAYRGGSLGHSLVSPERMIGKHSVPMLEKFVGEHLLSGEGALVGLDVDHGLLLQYATEAMPIREGKSLPLPPSKYLGGEVRRETGGPLAHVMLVGEGSSAQDPKGLVTQGVLSALLGNGPRMPYGSTGMGVGRLAKAASGAVGGGGGFAVTGMSAAHADSGLFGVYCAAAAERMGDVLRAVSKSFRDLAASGLNEEELKRAKAQAKAECAMRNEAGAHLFEDVGSQTLLGGGSILTPDELVSLVDAVTANDVQQAAKKIAGSKPSMAAVGTLDWTPYIDEL